MRRIVLSLSLSLSLLSAAAPLAAAGNIRGVVLRGGAWSELKAHECAPVERAWIWSDAGPPRAIDAALWKTACDARTMNALAVPGRTLELQLARKDRHASVALIAAPVAMWTEVPEALLPRHETREKIARVPHDGESVWRVRATSVAEGTAWLDVKPAQRSAVIAFAAAAARAVQVIASGGEPAAGAIVEVLRQHDTQRPEVAAQFLADARGRAVIQALPDVGLLHLVIRHSGHALSVVSANVAELPITHRLAAGSTLHGRFLAQKDEPVAGVNVVVEGWVSKELAHPFAAKATAAADGSFTLANLPRGAIAVIARKPGFLPHRATLDLERDEVTLGEITLERGVRVALDVTDDRGQPVARATVDAGAGRVATTDAKGKAYLDDIPPNGVRVTVTADRHLTRKPELAPPFENVTIRLPRAFVVRGRLVDADHLPITDAAMRIETGRTYRTDTTRAGGTFEVSLAPETDVTLAFSSASTSPVIVPVSGGNGGELRDLGDVVAPGGLVIAGRVIAPDGSPIAGARLWCPRPSPYGPLVAWMNGDILEALTAADGTFVVSGASAAPLVLRVDAQGFARAWRAVMLDAAIPRAELGDITLGEGTTLRVKTRSDEASVRVDLRGEGLEIDMLSATVRDGVAVVPRVPAGSATLQVVRGRRTVCEKAITIPEHGELDVACEPLSITVRGRVLVGDMPARGGSISWSSPTRANVASAVIERVTASGLRQQQAWGVAEPPVAVRIDDSGRFESDELRPGRWSVTYLSDSGGSAPRVIEIPELEEFETTLRFAGTAVAGVVVDAEGTPIPRAVVEVMSLNAVALAGDDGAFVLRGLVPGLHEVRARTRDGRTATESVRIEEGPDAPAMRLVLKQERTSEVAIAVTRAGGQPASGAFVFAELEGEGNRILTVDAMGRATLRLSDRSSPRLRLAAFDQGAWFFGPWHRREDAGRSVMIAIERGGELEVGSEKASGTVEILRSDGWNVSNLMRRIGVPPQIVAGTPLRLSGIAAGSYAVTLGAKTQQADVSTGRMQELRFE